MMQWDPNSGIRERLALLLWTARDGSREAIGRAVYDPSRDRWTVRAADGGPARDIVPIRQEGAASLEALAGLGVSRSDAMALIGHPEGGA